MRKLAFGPGLTACVVMGLIHCGGGGDSSFDLFDASPESGGPTGRDATPTEPDSSPKPKPKPEPIEDAGPDAAAPLDCTLTSSRVLAERADDDAGKSRPWLGPMRTVRVNDHLARTVARPSDGRVAVYSFDPGSTAPATSVELPFDRVLDTAYEDGALYIYGLSLTGSADAGADAGPDVGLFLSRIDDATDELTTRRLTQPGTVVKPANSYYEPPLGQFVRWGTDDVYFTYTEEVPPFTNPTYRLSVGRVTPSSGPIDMTLAATAEAHDYQEITARDLIHGGSSVSVFMGNSAQDDEYDGLHDSVQWILPDDGTVPPTFPKRGYEKVLLAAGRDGNTTQLAYADQDRFLDSYPSFAYASADDNQLASFEPQSAFEIGKGVSIGSALDVHFEGDQFLWFPRFWFDMKTHRKRADLPDFRNVPNQGFSNYSTASITFAEPPTEDHAKLYLVIPRENTQGTAYGLWLHVVTCGRSGQ